jgi:biopolymer transport protein ExbD
MKFGRPPEKDKPELKMTAMIDVVFQLLVFFLVGTKFRVPSGELEAYLPKEGAPTSLVQPPPDTIIKEIRVTLRVRRADDKDEPPGVLLDDTGAGGGPEPMSMNQLREKLNALGRDPDMAREVPVIIEAEAHLAYKWVVKTLSIARSAKFEKVNFAASKRNAPPAPASGGG